MPRVDWNQSGNSSPGSGLHSGTLSRMSHPAPVACLARDSRYGSSRTDDDCAARADETNSSTETCRLMAAARTASRILSGIHTLIDSSFAESPHCKSEGLQARYLCQELYPCRKKNARSSTSKGAVNPDTTAHAPRPMLHARSHRSPPYCFTASITRFWSSSVSEL